MEQSASTVNFNEESKELPKNLKTLCILSLIWGGLMILVSLWGIQKHYLPSEQEKLMMEQQMSIVQSTNPAAYDEIAKTMETQGLNSIIGLAMQLLSVIAVILMFKLKKTGFYLYIAGELLPYVFTIALTGFSGMFSLLGTMGEMVKTIGIIFFVFQIILDFVFIFLYSKQTKYMS